MTEARQETFASDRLDQHQRLAATASETVVAVSGGPGSGKTRALLGRADWLMASGVDPGELLMVTSTTGAVDDIDRRWREDLGKLEGPQFVRSTLRALASDVMSRYGPSAARDVPNSVWGQEQGRQVITLLARDWVDRDIGPTEATEALWWAQARAGQSVAAPCREEPDWSEVLAQYTDLKRRQRVLDVDDLVPAAVRMLEASDRQGLQRPARQWDHLVIDHLEDLTLLDWLLLQMLVRPGGSLTVGINRNERVGGMRGADDGVWTTLCTGDASRPAARVYELGLIHHRNRSIYALSSLLRQADQSQWSTDEAEGFPLGAQATGSELVIVRGSHADMDQAIIQQMTGRISQGRRWDEMACISYGRASLERFRDALLRRQAPHRTLTACPGRGEDPHMESVLALLQLVANPHDIAALTLWVGNVLGARQHGRRLQQVVARQVVHLARGYGGDLGEALGHEAGRHRPDSPAGSCLTSAAMAYQDLRRRVDEGALGWEELWSRTHGLAAAALAGADLPEPESGPTPSGTPVTRQLLAAFLCALAARDWPVTTSQDCLTLATAGEAKGLHWPLVWVIDANNDDLPDFAGSDLPQRREWIPQAFYVAVTRALEEVHAYCSQAPGRGVNPLVPPDLDGINSGVIPTRYVNARGEDIRPG